jgi:monoamine oxidase
MKTAVIGAGMAGLAAAQTLQQTGHEVVILEAKARVGGRTRTDYELSDVPVELGAEFIHGSKVLTWELVKQAGLTTAHWTKQADALVQLEPPHAQTAGKPLMTTQDAQKQFADFDMTRTWNLPDVPIKQGESWQTYLTRLGFTDTQLHYVARSFANAVSDSADRFCAHETLQSIQDETDGEGDYRILEGYSKLTAFLAEGLDIRLETPVNRINWQEGCVSICTNEDVLEADNVIITVPLGVLKAGHIRFVPDLPDTKQQALAGLRMGPVIKLVYVFEEAILPASSSAVYSANNPPMWWSPNFGHPQQARGEQVWTAFASGDWARSLLSEAHETTTEGMLMNALNSLSQALDKPLPKPKTMKLVNWPADPYTLGGYSYPAPGHTQARSQLAAPIPPLFWAGEATAPLHQTATVHGAFVSGKRAAQEVIALTPQYTAASPAD